MDCLRTLKTVSIGLSCIGFILPASVLEAAPANTSAAIRTAASQTAQLASDVQLDRGGHLNGVVLDAQGAPVAGAVVTLRQVDRQLARTRTDASGRFRAGPLRGGTYQLQVGGRARLVRVWAANTAPPAASDVALIVAGDGLVRGQLPLEEFCASDAVIIVGMVAAMIAIPIAVHNSRPRSP